MNNRPERECVVVVLVANSTLTELEWESEEQVHITMP
jgi:hypothetical protein